MKSNNTTIFDRYGHMNESRRAVVERLLTPWIATYGLHSAIDMGAGLGYFSDRLSSMGLKVTAVEARAENIEEGRRRYPTISFCQGDIEDVTSLNIEPADLVLCFGLLYHLENPFRAVRHLHRLTKRILLLESMIVPSLEPSALLYDEPFGQKDQGLNYIAFIPSEACLIRMLYQSGFTKVYKPVSLPAHPDFRDTGYRHRMRTVLVACRDDIGSSELELMNRIPATRVWDKNRGILNRIWMKLGAALRPR